MTNNNNYDKTFPLGKPYKHGSQLPPIVLTTCNDCFHYEGGEHKECRECGSPNIEVVEEEM